MTFWNTTNCAPIRRSSGYWLREGVYCGDAGEAFVFLDLCSGRYLALSRHESELPEKWIQRSDVTNFPLFHVEDTTRNSTFMSALARHGLVTQDPRHQRRTFSCFRKATSTVDCRDSNDVFMWQPQIASRFAFSYLTSSLEYPFSTLKRSLERLRARKLSLAKAVSLPTPSQLRVLMGHYLRLRTFTFTSMNRCVLDSLILCDFLFRNHVSPTFIIGVTLRPFRAHCWVQCDEVALNSNHELVELYSPVLVI
jgi:Transglutaminase-like superfamily